MKLIITGSLGHVSQPLAATLVKQGHSVTVISSSPDKKQAIEALGASAAIGSIEDLSFLTATFRGADAVYCMIPPNYKEPDQVAWYGRVSSNYAKAIQQSGIKRVVALSSYGAHLEKRTGFIVGSHNMEKLFYSIPDINTTYIRAGYFYYNLLNFIPLIKNAGFIASNYGGEDKLIMVSPTDLAAAVAEEIVSTGKGRNIRYVVSDDRTCDEVASVLGKAIGNPGLQWKTLTNEQAQERLEANGLPPATAATLVELNAAIHTGILREDYDRQPTPLGKVKIEDFAQEFAAAYL